MYLRPELIEEISYGHLVVNGRFEAQVSTKLLIAA